MGESYFDGGLLQLIGWALLGSLITVCTLGICFPWAICMIYNWEISHTVINGIAFVLPVKPQASFFSGLSGSCFALSP